MQTVHRPVVVRLAAARVSETAADILFVPVFENGAGDIDGLDAATGGQIAQRGYQLWADTVNKAGGLAIGDKKYQVDLIVQDCKSDPATGADATSRLATEEGVNAIFGASCPSSWSITIAVAPTPRSALEFRNHPRTAFRTAATDTSFPSATASNRRQSSAACITNIAWKRRPHSDGQNFCGAQLRSCTSP